MKTLRLRYALALLTGLAIVQSCRTKNTENHAASSQDLRLFTLLDTAQTHVAFVNAVEDKDQFNILSYRNFYNGGGVSIGDINNDSLPDLYFTSRIFLYSSILPGSLKLLFKI